MHAGCEKLKIAPEDCHKVPEEAGTETDQDVDIIELPGNTFVLLEKEQGWSNALTVTAISTPVPEPSKPIEALSEYPQAASANISMTF